MDSQTSLLVLNDDVLYLICEEVNGVVPLSSTCRRLRTMAAPILYRKLACSDRNKPARNRPNLEAFLDVVETSECCARFTRQLAIKKNEVAVVTDEEARKLSRALERLKHLRFLELHVNKGSGHILTALHKQQFPGVTTVALSLELRELMCSFPNVQNLEFTKLGAQVFSLATTLTFMRQARLSNLLHLDFGRKAMSWTPSALRRLSECLPNLQQLGTIRCGTGTDDIQVFEETITSLQAWTQLRVLSISFPMRVNPTARALRPRLSGRLMAHGSIDQSGNIHLTPDQKGSYMRDIGLLTFGSCPTLEEIWVEGEAVYEQGEKKGKDSLMMPRYRGDVDIQKEDLEWMPWKRREPGPFAW